MNVKELMQKFGLTTVTNPSFEDRRVNGCYIGDLLSWVMSRAKADNAWLTIQSNVNIVAVASLTDCACIILCEGVQPEINVIQKADQQGVIILKSNKTSYELACDLSKIL